MATLYKFKAYYTKSGVGAAPSSAPVATVVDTDAGTKLADAQATTTLANLVGYYEYEYSGADDLDLVCLFHTTDTTTDQQSLVSYVVDKVYQSKAKLVVIEGIVNSILADTGTDGVVLKASGLAADAVTEIQSGLALETTLNAVKAKTDTIPASPAAVGSAMTLTVGERTAIANEVESQIIDDTDAEKVLKAITDKIASVNPSLDDLTLAGIASAVRTELTTELARIDAAISTRLATAGYTAPANADISTIKSKTDNLPASPAASGEYTSALSAIQADLDNVSGSVGEALGRLDNVQAKTDLITTGTSLTIASVVSGSTITAHRGDTLSAALTNIGALTNNSKLWFTVKRDYDDADTAAVIQIEKTGGLLYLNGAVGTAGNGSLTINDEATGDVTIVLNASETAKLSPGNYQYDIQILRSAGTPVSTLTYGEFVVPADVTRATA